MSLASFVTYLSYEKNYSVHTVNAYKADLQAFNIYCVREYQIDAIDTVAYGIIRSWLVTLVDEGVSNRSVNRKIASLKAYYKFLQGVGVIDVNPLSKHKALKAAKKLEVPFSEKEMEQVLSQIEFGGDFEGVRDRLIIELLYTTGMRRIELVDLRVKDVDISRMVLKVLGKRNKERIVPMLPVVLPLFESYLNLRADLNHVNDEGHVFLLKSGNKIYGNLVYRLINKYFSEVSSKVKKSPHILRHTFATHLLNKGADMNSVKELLGHSSLASTQVYTHNSIAELKKVHSKAHPRSKE